MCLYTVTLSLLLCESIFCGAFLTSSTLEKRVTGCAFDGYVDSNHDEECVCQSSFLKGKMCTHFSCNNGGYQREDFASCNCPQGFLGVHCEPVKCVESNNAKTSTRNHHSLSILWTATVYSEKFCGVWNESVKDALLKLSRNLERTALKILNMKVLGSTSFDFSCNSSLMSFSECVKMYFDVILELCEEESCLNLSTAHILNALKHAEDNSQLFLIVNRGISNYDETGEVNKIIHYAISHGVKISAFIAFPCGGRTNTAYDEDDFLALERIVYNTLGIFVTPYRPDFAYLYIGRSLNFTQLITEITLKFLGTVPTDSNEANDAVQLNITIPKGKVAYIAVTTAKNSDYFIAPAPPNVTFNSSFIKDPKQFSFGYWHLFEIEASEAERRETANISSTVSLKYEIWQQPSEEFKQRTIIAYSHSSDTASFDASSPLPVAGVENIVVGYSAFDRARLIAISNPKSVKFALLETAEERKGCQFNRYFGTMNCSSEDYGRYMIESYASNKTFTEVVPFMCAQKQAFEDNDDPVEVSKILYLNDREGGTDCQEGSDHLSNLIDTSSSRSFGLVVHNRNSLVRTLFNTTDENNLLVSIKNLTKKKGDGYFKNFLTALFTKDKPAKVEVAEDYIGLKDNILKNANWKDNDVECSDNVPLQTTLIGLLEDTQITESFGSKSEVYVITDQPYGKDEDPNSRFTYEELLTTVHKKKVKLNFLIYYNGTCKSAFNNEMNMNPFWDLAQRSGGIAARFDDVYSIVEYFEHNLFGSQVVLQSDIFDKSDDHWSEDITRDFYYNRENEYVFTAHHLRLPNGKPRFLQMEQDGTGVANATEVFSTYDLTIYKLPKDIDSGKYRLRLVATNMSATHQYRLYELNSAFDYTLAFTTNPEFDATAASPNFGGGYYPVFTETGTPPSRITLYSQKSSGVSIILNGTTTKERKSCDFGEILEYNWFCNEPNATYYFEMEFEKGNKTVTRTEAVSCITSGDSGDCLHQGKLMDNKCACTVQYTGEKCEIPVCFNGGTVTSSFLCDCPAGFKGDFCEQALNDCKGEKIAEFRKEYASLIIILHKSFAVKGFVAKQLAEQWNYAQQYVVVTFGANDDEGTVIISTPNADPFSKTLQTTVNSFSDASYSSSPFAAIKKAINAQLTGKSLVILIVDEAQLNISQPFDSKLELLFANNNVEIRVISVAKNNYMASVPSGYLQKLAALGNGVAIQASNEAQDGNYQNYINYLLPTPEAAINPMQQKRASTVDYRFLKQCTDFSLHIPAQGNTILVTLTGDIEVVSATNNQSPGWSSGISKIFFTKEDVNLKANGNGQCGYMIEVVDHRQIAYAYSTSLNFERTAHSAVHFSDDHNFVYKIIGYDAPSLTGLNDFPRFDIFAIDNNGTQKFVDTLPSTNRKNCAYNFYTKIPCNDTAYKAVISGSSTGFKRTLTVYCPDLEGSCLNGGTYDNITNVCNCVEHYKGQHCETKCTHGVAIGGSCLCQRPYKGESCDQLVVRDFYFILNKCGIYQQLIDEINGVISDLVNTISFNETTHHFFSVDDKDAKRVKPWRNSSDMESELSAITRDSCTPELDSALSLIRKFKFSDASPISNANEDLTSNLIFYITQTSPATLKNKEDLQYLSDNHFKLIPIGLYKYEKVDLTTLEEISSDAKAFSSSRDVFEEAARSALGEEFTAPTEPYSTTKSPRKPYQKSCAWVLQSDIYLFIDGGNVSQSYFNQSIDFGIEFGSGLNLGKLENHSQIVYNELAGSKLYTGLVVLLCNRLLRDLQKATVKNQEGTNYTTALEAVKKTISNPEKFGARENGTSGVIAKSRYILFLTHHENSLDDSYVNISSELKNTYGVNIYFVYFNDNDASSNSHIYNIATKRENGDPYLYNVHNNDEVNPMVQNVWKQMCENEEISENLDVEPNADDIRKFDLVILRDSSSNIDADTYEKVTEQINNLINGLNTDYQKVGLISVSDTPTIVFKNDEICKTKILKKFKEDSPPQSTSEKADLESAMDSVTEKVMRLNDGHELLLLFITTSKEAKALNLKSKVDKLRTPLRKFEVAAVAVGDPLVPDDVHKAVDCVLYDRTIEKSFVKVMDWLQGLIQCDLK